MANGSWIGYDQVRDALRELADESVQRELWRSAQSPADFTECIEMLFGDSALGRALEKGHAVFDDHTDELLRQLHDLVKRIDGRRSLEDVISDPLMPQVRRLASDALQATGRGGLR